MIMFGSSRRRKDEPDTINWEKYRHMFEYGQEKKRTVNRLKIIGLLLFVLLLSGTCLLLMFLNALI